MKTYFELMKHDNYHKERVSKVLEVIASRVEVIYVNPKLNDSFVQFERGSHHESDELDHGF